MDQTPFSERKASQTDDYQRIARAIHFLETHFRSQPSLDQIAQSVHLSKYHFERMFKRWAGISPKQFLRFLTLDYTKRKLAASATLLDAAYDAGLSGPGRLHDLFVTFDAVSPGDYKRHGAGLTIRYGYAASPFGACQIAMTEKGICSLMFCAPHAYAHALEALQAEWPGAVFKHAPNQMAATANRIFDIHHSAPTRPFHLHLKGTNFQVNVWQALLRIPAGAVVSYQDIATWIGRPTAHRAAASAIGRNPVGYLIPCHRVIAKSGRITPYRWGMSRKKAMIAREAAIAV